MCLIILEIVNKSRDSLLITAPVLVPNEKDCEYFLGEEPLTPEQVEEIAHTYLANYSLVDKNHEFFKTRELIGVPVESYITQKPVTLKNVDGEVRDYPVGTWIVTVKVTDSDEIQKILNGEYNGYSVTTISKKFADKQMQIPRRVLMKDIPDPVGFTVSLVKNPCVKGAKFCNMKSDDGVVMSNNIEEQIENETQGFLQSIKGILNINDENKNKNKESNSDEGSDEKTVEYVSVEDFEAFKTEVMDSINNVQIESDKKLEEVSQNIFTAINQLGDDFKESIKNLQSEGKDDETNDGEGESEVDDETDGDKTSVKNCNNSKNKKNKGPTQSTKSIPNHDVKNKTSQVKTGALRVYEIMGRDSTGSAIRK